jgi:hypothetical protein
MNPSMYVNALSFVCLLFWIETPYRQRTHR